MKKQRWKLIGAALLLAGALAGCAPQIEPVSQSNFLLDTVVTVTLYDSDDRDILEGWLVSMLDRMEAEGRLTERERKAVWTPDLSGFYLSALGRRMVKAAVHGTLKREQQFLLGVSPSQLYPDIKAPEDEILMIQGVIDAWFEENGKLILVDYKTDRVEEGNEAVLLNRYGVQIFQYERALRMITGKEVGEAWIYSFSLRRGVKVT